MSGSLFAEDGDPLPAMPLPLEPGEVLLWYGEPDTDLALRLGDWREMLFGTLGLGLALATLHTLQDASLVPWQVAGQWLLVLGLIVGSVALWVLPPLGDRDARRHKRYWLTSSRALIQNEPRAIPRHPGGDPLRQAGWWITRLSPAMPLRRWHRTVRFAWFETRYKTYRYKEGVGFDRIDSAPRVLALMRRLIAEAP